MVRVDQVLGSFPICEVDLFREGPSEVIDIWDPRRFLLNANNLMDTMRYLTEEKELINSLLTKAVLQSK
ncbi:MAG: hypothetical protein PXY39_02090 [archaeon]|nr:hypothetical protein [archaeon]